MVRDYSPEEIAEMHDRNESFNGSRANFAKMQLFHQIKSDLVDFISLCDDVKRIEEIKPNPYEQNAVIFMDMDEAATLDKTEVSELSKIMCKADRVIVSAANGMTRFSFGVEKIWEE